MIARVHVFPRLLPALGLLHPVFTSHVQAVLLQGFPMLHIP